MKVSSFLQFSTSLHHKIFSASLEPIWEATLLQSEMEPRKNFYAKDLPNFDRYNDAMRRTIMLTPECNDVIEIP
ncbi:hypothetical protein TWF103_009590 [Orbilia oligospora]|nr:hypothetical protein TWF103_009590 [Orbilia oligospora]